MIDNKVVTTVVKTRLPVLCYGNASVVQWYNSGKNLLPALKPMFIGFFSHSGTTVVKSRDAVTTVVETPPPLKGGSYHYQRQWGFTYQFFAHQTKIGQ
jgi:hypothetical protein